MTRATMTRAMTRTTIGAALLWRLGVGTLLGLALFWYVGVPAFRSALVPDWVLSGCLALGWIWPAPRRWLHGEAAAGSAPRWLAAAVLLALAVLVALVAGGALATGSRHWDGMVLWDVRAQILAAEPTLDQPYFRDTGVYCHSRDYPLLQPFAIASLERLTGAGRLLFPLLLACFAALVGIGARRVGTPAWLPWIMALACAGTPMLVNPSGGGADSGYADLLLATCVAAMAVGIARDQPLVLALGALLAIASKPEGLVVALLPIVVALARGARAQLHAAVAGYTVGMLSWLSLRARLHWGISEPSWEYFAVLGLAAALIGVDAFLRRVGARPRQRGLLTLSVGAFAAIAVLVLPIEWDAVDTAIGHYLGERGRLSGRLLQLPAILGGFVEHGVLRLNFGVTFVLPVLAAWALWRTHRPPPPRLWACAAFVGLGLAAILAPFLLSPEPDLRHHLRASMARLQLHWLGATWILTAGLLHELLVARAEHVRAGRSN